MEINSRNWRLQPPRGGGNVFYTLCHNCTYVHGSWAGRRRVWNWDWRVMASNQFLSVPSAVRLGRGDETGSSETKTSTRQSR